MHALYQEVLYAQVSASRRVRLHQQIGARLEEGYGAEAQQIAAELATHFSQGRDVWRAIPYLRLAGENALRRSAYQEAIEHLTHGLALLHTLPETTQRSTHELAVLTVLGPALMAKKGYAAPEVERTYFRARELCQQLGDTPQLFPSLRGLWVFYLLRADLETAHELSEQLLALAQSTQDSGHLLAAHHTVGQSALWYRGLAPARAHLEQGIALYDAAYHRSHAVVYGQDSGVACRALVALVLWFQGYPEQALQRASAALTLAQELAHPNSLAVAMHFAAWIHLLRRQVQRTSGQAETLVALARRQGLPFWEAAGRIWSGWAAVAQGQGVAGMTQLRQGVAAWQDTGATLALPQYQILLAEAYGQVGQPDRGLTVLTEALELVGHTGERLWKAELYRLQGQLLLAHTRDNRPEAETCLRAALAIARSQQARSWELRAATSLARLWQEQGKRGAACELLTPVYGWFTEGFDTQDLQEAKALLVDLTS
jgi:predicted ATPase